MNSGLPALAVAAALTLGLSACGSNCASVTANAPAAQPTGMLANDLKPAQPGSGGSTAGLPNACPAEGCRATIISARRAAGGELSLALTANFSPDVSHNHFHIYWDHFTAQQVSDDAQPRFGVTQGDWVPTADNPYTTADATSMIKRGNSTKICVTAGDRNHDVLDPTLYSCYDISALTGPVSSTAAASETAGMPNACPAEGCRATIVSARRAPGGELILTLSANFAPDLSGNHLHVYWDHFAAKQISLDAQPRFGVTQGQWEAVAELQYTTAGATSVISRRTSPKICVTAADHNHDVLDPTLYSCYDITSLL